MKKYDVVVIGGGPAGIVAATTAKNLNPDKSILIIKEEHKGLVPCGIPYVFHALGCVENNSMEPRAFIDAGGEIVIGRVTDVLLKSHEIQLASGELFQFEKLIFATGSRPLKPVFLKGHDLKNVELVPKSYSGLEQLKRKTDNARQIVVLGSGFTAVELAEQLSEEPGKDVYLIFRAEHCLHKSFSCTMAAKIDRVLRETNVKVHNHLQVSEIYGDNGVARGVRVESGETFEADIVIAAMGYQANTEIAENAGVYINSYKQIIVDNYMRTNVKDIYAIGDCAETRGFITGAGGCIMLASTAAAEARILGYNLFGIRIKHDFQGTLSVFSTEINNTVFASAGVLVQDAQNIGISYVCGEAEGIDRHPGKMPGARFTMVRLVVMPGDGQIIGGEISGGKVCAEMINTIALAIQKYVTVYELLSFQIGTHPLLSAAPTVAPLIKAAENAIAKIDNMKIA